MPWYEGRTRTACIVREERLSRDRMWDGLALEVLQEFLAL
ncbi:hypothetical protein Pd630_LPD04656 [Rhodococcus opacus PD630]|nr:hypothetical protein Pd630_LPD04656 [Rhodococcus opacus PD630]